MRDGRAQVITCAVAVLALGGAGCRAGFRSSAGSAFVPEKYGDGVSRSVVIGDEGGLLSRLGLGSLGAVSALGAIRDPNITTTTTTNGNTTVVTQERQATIDGQALTGSQAIVDAASSGRLSSASGGLAANLEIASRSLGGDTSGAQFDMGWAFRRFRKTDTSIVGVRGYVGVGYGAFTMHGRILDRIDRGPPMFEDAKATFFGLPTRVGLFYVRKSSPFAFTKLFGAEAFAKADLNSSGRQRLRVGGRLQLSLLYAEVEVMTSSLDGADRSVGLEVGAGF